MDPLELILIRSLHMETECEKGDECRVFPVHPDKGCGLVFKNGSGDPGIGQGIVLACGDQFIVLYQPVIGVFRKGQGREKKGVNDRKR